MRPPTTTATRRRHFSPMEPLESRVLLHANPVLDAEHAAVFALVPDAAATYKSIAAGNWSDPATWTHFNGAAWTSDGTLPGNNANVIISAGTTVTVDGIESRDALGHRVALHTIRDDGTLRFATTVNTELLVDTLIVSPAARFEIGTPADPIRPTVHANLYFADSGDIDLAWDPLQFSRGLISHGSVSISGSDVTSFISLPQSLAANATTIDLGTLPAGWKVGDRLVITGDTATNANNLNQDEQVAIKAINGSKITLGGIADANGILPAAKLKFNHSAGSVYISNVSRNVVLASESILLGDNTVAHRGHTMFMHTTDVHINAAGFYGLGRTDKRTLIDDPVLVPDTDHPGQMTTDVLALDVNPIDGTHRVYVPDVDANGLPIKNPDGTTKLEIARTGLNPRGRYAVHFHRADGDTAATISDSAVVDSPGWGIVNHSSFVDVTDNTVFNAVGAAYATEVGNETGSFRRNIALHSKGSGNGIESRKQVQDFGHQGDGFWLQGGNVSLTDNVAAGQRHAGFVFFPVGLDEKGLGVATIEADELLNPAWANGKETIPVGDVPLREFKGNKAFASGDGFESWFSMLNVKDARRTLIQNFSAWKTNSAPIFTPYTNQITFQNVTLTGNLAAPRGKAFDRNMVTRSVQYIDVNVQGFETGIDVAVNGNNTIQGGTFRNVRDILVSTASDRGRTVDFIDDPSDLITFLDLTPTALGTRTHDDIFLASNFNPFEQDITDLFNPDVIRMGTVRYNGKQLYYLAQASNFVPFPIGQAATYVPPAFLGLTNQQLMDQYGLAIGGIVAPPDAAQSDPRINALIGAPATYLTDLALTSAKYFSPTKPYILSYRYKDVGNPKANLEGWVSVKETTPSALLPGWNVITRTIAGHIRSLLVYSDAIAPTFEFATGTPNTINKADIDNGATFVIQGNTLDDSFGKRHFYMTIKLNDPKYVSPVKTRADGTQFITISFLIKDFAGNAATITLDLTVTATAILQKDLTRKDLPLITPSLTLLALLGVLTTPTT